MSATVDKRPIPLSDPDTAPYWAAARKHEFKLPRCRLCSRYVFPPKPICPACGEASLEWQEVSGRGTVFAFTIMRDNFMGGFEPPYSVAEVELEEQPGLFVVANIVGCEISAVRNGMPVEVTFEDRSESVTVPQFRPRKT